MDPIIPQPEQYQVVTPESSPKHFLNKKFAITFLILILLGAGTYASIWYWQKQQLAQEVVPTLTPRPSATPDPTAGWKTYTNTQYGFEFRYPSGWVVDSAVNSTNVMVISPEDLALNKTIADRLAGFSIQYQEKFSNFGAGTVEELFAKFLQESKDPTLKLKIYNPKLIEFKQDKAVAVGESAYSDVYSIYVFHNNHGYRLWFGGHKDELSLTDVDNQILSTFKFTDSNQLSCGGIAGKLCPSGYSCKLDGSYPDAGGVCVK